MFKLIHKRVPSNAKNDILSGLTVALALVPEAVAFALLAGLNPLVGLYAAFTIGLITSIIGGRPGMISGATGAIAVTEISTTGRHDPCVGIRATPIAEAMLAITLMDHALRHRAQNADVSSTTPPVPAEKL